MKFIEVFDNIENLDRESIIFMNSTDLLSKYTDVYIMHPNMLPNDGKTPPGLTYILEVDLFRNVLEVWKNARNGKEPTLEEKYRAIIYYVEMDAYLPLEE